MERTLIVAKDNLLIVSHLWLFVAAFVYGINMNNKKMHRLSRFHNLFTRWAKIYFFFLPRSSNVIIRSLYY